MKQVYLAAIVLCVAMILMTVIFVVVRLTSQPNVIRHKSAAHVAQHAERINISTRGEQAFQQVGVLYSNDDKNHVLPLYGRPTYVGSQKWNYYTKTDGFQSIQLGIQQRNHDCLDMIGCSQLENDDQLQIVELNNATFKVRMYKTNVPRYLPNVI